MVDKTSSPEPSIDALLEGSQEHLLVSSIGATRFLIFNRPAARNALSRAMREEFARRMAEADKDPAVDVVIVTGAHGSFSSGVDLKETPQGIPGAHVALFRPHPVEVARGMTKPVIAMVDGPCVTGGLELALACSFVLASTRSRFVDTHLKIGKFPGWGLNSLLPSAIGARRARQMQITGEFVDAERAYQWGLVNELVTPDRLLARCLEISALISACPQSNVRRFIALSRRLEGLPLDTALAIEAETLNAIRAGL